MLFQDDRSFFPGQGGRGIKTFAPPRGWLLVNMIKVSPFS